MRPRIAICDDSPAYRRVIQGMLGGGYEFLLCESGEEALARAPDWKPDLVISDLVMTGVDGYELCRRLKAMPELRTTPVVLLTSKTDDDAKAAGLEVGADDYLFKPVRARELVARVTSLLKLKRAQDELVRTEKLASLGQLIAGIAHEINNPLNYIYGNVGFLEEYARTLLGLVDKVGDLPALTDEQRRTLEAWKKAADVAYIRKDLDKLIDGIRQGAERAAEIVKGLRIFARSRGAAPDEPVDLAKVIELTLTLLRHELKDRITVVRDLAPVPAVRGDGARLAQVFMNLLRNAAQAIDGKGTIRVALAAEGGFARCAITDDGAGIAPEILPRIFDPFFTTRDVGEGTGLGLSVAYAIVDAHGGRIEVASERGKGSTFTVYLPLATGGVAGVDAGPEAG